MESEESEKNRIDEILRQYNRPDQYQQLFDELNKLNKDDLSEIELESWYNLRGSVQSRLENYPAAIEILTEGVEACPESAYLRLNLGMVVEIMGDVKTMVEQFLKVNTSEIDARTLLMMARLCYLWDYYNEGLKLIEPIFSTYYDLGIADDNFLYMRGLPFYGDSFGYKAVFGKLSNQPEIAINELEKAKERLADYPFSLIEQNLNAFLSEDWSEILQELNKLLDKEDMSLGVDPTIKALIESRNATDYDSAIAPLGKVRITTNDFPWLNDIICLGFAEAAHRFGKEAEEKRRKEEFFEYQPILFEPEHVFRFGLLEYQEILKKDYQEKRKKKNK